MSATAVPRSIVERLLRALPSPKIRRWADAVAAEDMPKGYVRQFNCVASSVPGARKHNGRWSIPIDVWHELRCLEDPPAECFFCHRPVISRLPHPGEVIVSCDENPRYHRRAERLHPIPFRVLVHLDPASARIRAESPPATKLAPRDLDPEKREARTPPWDPSLAPMTATKARDDGPTHNPRKDHP